MCINETLRIKPSARITFTHKVTETIRVNGFNIRDDHPMLISIYSLHHNPLEWRDPEKFIPERFDPTSEFYLRPDGKKRNPFSFGPFLGGRRICIGKTFAENIAKCVLSIILNQVKFEFIDKSLYERYPRNNLQVEETPIIVRVKTL